MTISCPNPNPNPHKATSAVYRSSFCYRLNYVVMQLFGLLLLCCTASATAGTISLAMTARAEAGSSLIKLQLQLQNQGDEAAQAVRLVLTFDQQQISLNEERTLAPGQTLQQNWQSSGLFLLPGRRFLPLQVYYQDQNGYRFNMAYVIEVVIGHHQPAGLVLQSKQDPLADSRHLQLSLTNTDPWPKTVFLTAVMPMDIRADLPETVQLAANEHRQLSLVLQHQSLWPNQYQAYLIASFTHQGQNYAHTATVTLDHSQSTTAAPAVLNQDSLLLILLLLLSAALLVVYLPRMRKAK